MTKEQKKIAAAIEVLIIKCDALVVKEEYEALRLAITALREKLCRE